MHRVAGVKPVHDHPGARRRRGRLARQKPSVGGVVDLDPEDYVRVHSLLRTYADRELEFVDATVIAVAERLEQTVVATLDRRHFSIVRPLHCDGFTIVP